MEFKYEEKSNEFIINTLQAENRFTFDVIFQLVLLLRIVEFLKLILE